MALKLSDFIDKTKPKTLREAAEECERREIERYRNGGAEPTTSKPTTITQNFYNYGNGPQIANVNSTKRARE